MPTPVVLDTDIGTDIDDAYALILAAASPEIDLRAVTTVNHDVRTRGRIAMALLRLLGRGDVPVAAGEAESLTPGETRGWGGHEGRGIDLSGVSSDDLRPEPASAVLAHHARRAHDEGVPLTVITIGAMTNVARALREHPQDMALVRAVVAMGSTYEGYGPENARPEHNIACDPVAAGEVLESGLPVDLIGLNVTMQTTMTREQVDRMAALGGPLAAALAGMHRVWFDWIGHDRSAMHDGLAVASVLRPDLVSLLPVRARAALDSGEAGAIVYNAPAAGEVTRWRIATSVDVPAFDKLLHERVARAVLRAAG